MTLYEKLVPSNKEKIQKEIEKYPSTGRLIMSSLKGETVLA